MAAQNIIEPTTHHRAAAAAAAAIGSESTNSKVFEVVGVAGSGDVEKDGGEIYRSVIMMHKGGRTHEFLTRAVWDAYDGLLSTGSFMMGVGAIRKDVKTMLLGGTVGLAAGATTLAIKKYAEVKSQYDIKLAEMQRQRTRIDQMKKLPNAYLDAFASALAFSVGASVPLIGAVFVNDYKLRLGVVVGVVSLALIIFGGLIGVLGKAPWMKSSLRGLIAGWLGMAATFGLAKLADHFAIDY